MKETNKKRAVLLAVALMAATCVFAQQPQASSAFDTINTQLKDVAKTAITTFQYVCGIGAFIGGVMVVFKFIQGDQDASKKAGQFMGGLIVFLAVLQLIKSFFFSGSLG